MELQGTPILRAPTLDPSRSSFHCGEGPNTFVRDSDVLSRKFWSGGKIGPGDQNFRNIGPGGPFFPENFGPPVKISVRPASQVNSACCCLVRLIEPDYYTMEDSCN